MYFIYCHKMAAMKTLRNYGVLLLLVSVGTLVLAEDEEATVEVEEEDAYTRPTVDPKKVYLAEHFDDVGAFKKKWVQSEAKKQGVDENIAKYDGKWEIQTPVHQLLKDDLGLVLTTEAKHAAISALLDKPFEFKEKPLVVQYEVTMQEGQNCGGAYIKLLSKGTNTKADLRKFYDQTAYTIMFGPDKCGNDNKLHFIMRHKNPKNGTFEEKHGKKPSQRLDDIYKDKEPHLYTLVLRPDNTFTIFIDNKEVNTGSLLEDMTPPINPSEEIDDPNDKKPQDWDEREKIVDPSATKPEDWDEEAPAQIVDPSASKPSGWLEDEPEMISDPNAEKPSDWDEEMDGEWEPPLVDNPACTAAPGCGPWSPPLIANPNYKGIWRAPLIPNPNYKGKWTPRKIKNPDYFRDDHPFKMTPIHAVGFELWSMSPLLLFDNLIITDDPAVAEQWAAQTFALKRAKISKDAKSLWGRMVRAMNYKPGYWAMYIIYCCIPLSIYIGYLIKRYMENEDSVVDRAIKFAGDNPWVYAVLIFILMVIIGSIVYACSGTSPAEDSYGESKKTDEMTEFPLIDDEEDEEEEDNTNEEHKPKKADLEGPDSTEAVPEQQDGSGDTLKKRKPRKE